MPHPDELHPDLRAVVVLAERTPMEGHRVACIMHTDLRRHGPKRRFLLVPLQPGELPLEVTMEDESGARRYVELHPESE